MNRRSATRIAAAGLALSAALGMAAAPNAEAGTAHAKIRSYRVSPTHPKCHGNATVALSLKWKTRNTDHVTISVDGPGIYATYGANDSATINLPCDGSSHSYLLTAYGHDGGTATRTVSRKGK